jgi:hypothetical protein
VKKLLSIEAGGIKVLLKKGQKNVTEFKEKIGRKISVVYSPLFQRGPGLIPQQPDMMITFEDEYWPKLHFLLDAKYRIDSSDRYVKAYGSPGPPEDAINVLHRYRDSILEVNGGFCYETSPKRSVVQAAALFPHKEMEKKDFSRSKLWKALENIGIGAIPLLPEETEYLYLWLQSALSSGGWTISNKVIPHLAKTQSSQYRAAAAETVLVSALIGSCPAEHLRWISKNRQFYIPHHPTQKRQYVAKFIALYSPASLRGRGAVTHVAQVKAVDVISYQDRVELNTPWESHRKSGKYVSFDLEDLEELGRPIAGEEVRRSHTAIRGHRWTSHGVFSSTLS